MRFTDVAANAPKPFIYFAKADSGLKDADVSGMRVRLARELKGIVGYMSKCDLEKNNEPVVVLFTQLEPEVIRARVGTRTGASRVSNSAGMTTAASPTTLSLSASSSFRLLESSAVLSNLPLHEEQQKLLRQLHASIEETRDVANPRFLILCNIARPWMWTFVFLRSYDRLRQGLHRLYPAAVQVVLDRRVQPKPRLIMVDDFTVRSDIQARFKSRVLTMLGPLLKWMGREDMEGDDEPVPVLLTACDVSHLAQRVVLQPLADLSDLTDHEVQRLLLARDRLHDIHRSLKPRLIFVINWTQAGQWAAIICRDHDKLLPGISNTLPDVQLYLWKQRRLPQLTDAVVTDYCYCSSCPNRGKPLEGVKFCPSCKVAKYCGIECQQQHWASLHCRFCNKLGEGKLQQRFMASTTAATLRQSREDL